MLCQAISLAHACLVTVTKVKLRARAKPAILHPWALAAGVHCNFSCVFHPLISPDKPVGATSDDSPKDKSLGAESATIVVVMPIVMMRMVMVWMSSVHVVTTMKTVQRVG